MFYATRYQVYWGPAHNMIFGSTLIWYHTEAQRHTEHSRINTVLYKYILTPPVMCSQQLCVLYFTEWMTCWYQKFHNIFLIRFNKSKFFLWNKTCFYQPIFFIGKIWPPPSFFGKFWKLKPPSPLQRRRGGEGVGVQLWTCYWLITHVTL